MSTPQIPPRPSRSQATEPAPAASNPGADAPAANMPIVPPRPANKAVSDRAESPRLPSYSRSPLHESGWHPHGTDGASDLHRMASLNASRGSIDLPLRPPSVSLPSIGQEGIEYDASTPPPEDAVAGVSGSPAGSPTHTRKVSTDLPLHAPRPSLSSSEAKQRVAAVVRTDSNAAATAGAPAGSPRLAAAPSDRSLRSKPSFNRPGSSSSYDRPGSSYDEEHGIPSFGQQVPLGSRYGDVQAPSPALGAQSSQPNTPSTAGFERPSSARHHQRTKSGRNSFQAPPGSYGLHGHGNYEQVDDFEKAWLQKHPDALREEIAAHSPAIIDRHDYTLTPEQLNKIVRQSHQGGFGTSGGLSMPDEQIGYLASEAYASQNATPRPISSDAQKLVSPTHLESSLRTMAAAAAAANTGTDPSLSEQRRHSIIHVDEPEHKESKHIGRGQVSEKEHVDLGPRGGNTTAEGGFIDENGYGVPILASDEFDPANVHLHPAVPPLSETRRGSHYSEDGGSRPSSRVGNVQSPPALHKTTSRPDYGGLRHLEDVREYEPLFPDEEPGAKKPSSAAERFKQRPDMKQRFPSKDIWEDAPASVNLEAEVETPEPERRSFAGLATAFETAEQEAARKGVPSEGEKAKLLPKEARLAQSAFKPHIKQEMRPSIAQQRFPSRDIWEDTPDSAYITTTVDEDEYGRKDEDEDDEGAKAGAVVHTQASLPREGATAGAAAVQPATNNSNRPVIPPRPTRGKSPAKDDKTPPLIPARPVRRPSPSPGRASPSSDGNVDQAKPSIPARPAKSLAHKEQAASDAGATERAAPPDVSAKPKPQVPSRPVGGKIAALQAGFMSDLNKKLGLGPQSQKPTPAEEEKVEEEKKPLEDARKGRARGPARRKPAASPSAGAAAAGTTASATTASKAEPRKFVASSVVNLWDISPTGGLNSTHADQWLQKLTESTRTAGQAPVSRELPPAVGTNAQGEPVHPPTVTPEAVKATSQVEGAPALQAEAETSGEPADLGHAAIWSTSAAPSMDAKLASAAATSIKEPEPEAETHAPQPDTTTAARQEIKTSVVDDVTEAELKHTSSAGSQTGEMNIIMGKGGESPKSLRGYRNGSAHEEGIAFVDEEDKLGSPEKQEN